MSKNSPHSSIIITHQPPAHVFSDEWFDVGFNFSSSFPEHMSPEHIELCANMYLNLEGRCESVPVMDDDEIDIHLATEANLTNPCNGQSFVKCKIKSPAMRDGRPVFYNIKFFQRMKGTGAIIKDVQAAVSTKVQIVIYKLSLECDWGVPIIFYKDEGGKEKHLKAIIRLYGSDGKIVKGTHVPLKLSLRYDNDECSDVLRQKEILRLLDSSKHFIDPDNGMCSAKFRIEDVSKNHQGLKFRLHVRPEGNRSANIGHTISPGISVRSKRNKRTLSPGRRSTQVIDSARTPEPLSQKDSSSSSPERENKLSKRQFPNTDLNVAINHVSEWSKEVSSILPTLNWTLLGYCQNADGSVDYSKPNHLMPYPNDCINRLMNSYSNNVFQSLDVIRNEIERGSLRRKVGEDWDPHQTSKVEQKHGYRENLMTTHFLPTPITPLSPCIGIQQSPATYSQDLDRRRPNYPPDFLANKATRASSNNGINENDELIKKVECILAKHIYSQRGEKLGFPVCDRNRDILGFFKESDVGECKFSPISNIGDFSPKEAADVKRIVEDAINQQSQAVHQLKDCGSITSLFDHAMVYDWSKEISHQQPFSEEQS